MLVANIMYNAQGVPIKLLLYQAVRCKLLRFVDDIQYISDKRRLVSRALSHLNLNIPLMILIAYGATIVQRPFHTFVMHIDHHSNAEKCFLC